MKRWTLRILICLVLGVVTTVGVAWGFVIAFPERQHESLREAHLTELVRTALEAEFGPVEWEEFLLGDPFAWNLISPGVLVEVRGYHIDQGFGSPSRYLSGGLFRTSVGWPRRALRDVEGMLWIDGEANEIEVGGIVIDQERSDPRFYPPDPKNVLPVRPIWSGFILNTFLYGIVWFVMLFGIAATRRAIRKKRGRCVRCGYDLRGSVTSGQDARCTGCPECGWGREL